MKEMFVNKHKVTIPFLLFRNLEAPETPVYSVKGHKEIINSIDGVGGLGIGEGAPEIVTGSRDGKLVPLRCHQRRERGKSVRIEYT